MKRELTVLIAIIGMIAFSSSSFAIDEVVHALVDEATGRHYQDYYSYDRHGHDDGYYGRRYYHQTTYRGGHRRHHDDGVATFSIGHGHGHDRGHGHGHDTRHDEH